MTDAGQGHGPVGLIGHSGATSLLDRSLESDRLSHAYLFVGPKHVGKMALALYLAKAVNCPNEGEKPCNNCPQCLRIASGAHADVQVIGISEGEEAGQGTTRIGIERIRELQRQASLHPYEGTCRVFIIDGAELLSHEAANCLLKTLEEPPPSVLLLLLSIDGSYLLPTILSRCQRVELRPTPVPELASALAHHYSLDEEKAQLLARLSGGCPGWAISAARDDAVLNLRVDALDRLIALNEKDLEGRFKYAAELANLFFRDREAARNILELWLSWWRDLLLVKGGVGDLATNTHRRGELEEQSRRYSLSGIQGFIHSLTEARSDLERNANPRLVMEFLMLRLSTNVGAQVT